jgi:aryl-phospho-beta-D-glucosidase BglC (GH1 family)
MVARRSEQKLTATSSAFAKAYPDTVDAKFQEHWKRWFSQADVKKLKQSGINTVRIPVWQATPFIATK